MICAFGIYCITLAKAWRNRRALAGLFNPLNENPFGALITTDVEIVSCAAHEIENEDRYALAERTKAQWSPPQMESSYYSANIQVQHVTKGRKDSRPYFLRVGSFTRNVALGESNPEAWLYARVAFLFFAVMMICWTPASINRLYSTIRPDELVFGLNFAAIVLLPLQGLLNAIVYAVSSQSAVRGLFGDRFVLRSFKRAMTAGQGSHSSYVEVLDPPHDISTDKNVSSLPHKTAERY